MGWPFKRLKQHSSFTLHGLTVKFAEAVIKVPAGSKERGMAVKKTVERSFRMGVRLGYEFDISPAALLDLARTVIESEIPKAKAMLDTADANMTAQVAVSANDLVVAMLKDASKTDD